MAVVAHTYPSSSLAALRKTLNEGTDTLTVMLIAAGTYNWNGTSQAHVHVSDFLAGSGSGPMTEVSTSGTAYTRQALTSVTLTQTGLIVAMGCANPTWPTATLSASYAVFFDNTVGGTDSTNQMLGYWDFGSAQSVTGVNFGLAINAGGLLNWNSS